MAQQEAIHLVDQGESIHSIIVNGKVFSDLPKDLYIPTDALQIFLEKFTGPLDLLMYLIKKQDLSILDISTMKVTEQYMRYVDAMFRFNFDLVGEYLVMAAVLAEIKSRMLLPKVMPAEEEESDPRVELVKRLREYERFKKAATQMGELPHVGDGVFLTYVEPPPCLEKDVKPEPVLVLDELLEAMSSVLMRERHNGVHVVRQEKLSVCERMSVVLERLRLNHFLSFNQLLNPGEGRAGVVVTFIVILELLRQSVVDVVQSEPLAPIQLKVVS